MALRVKPHPQDLNQRANPRTMTHSTETMLQKKIFLITSLNSEVRMDLTRIPNNLRMSTQSIKTSIEQNNNKNSHNVDQKLTKVPEVHKQMININMDNSINKSIIKIEKRI